MVSVTFFKVGGKLGFIQGVCLRHFPSRGHTVCMFVCQL